MGLLSKIFGYSKNRKNNNRELSNKDKSDKTENKENKKRRKFMENEKSVNNEVEEKDTNTNSTEEIKEETKDENTSKMENVEEKGNEQAEEQVDEQADAQAEQVQEVEAKGNGIRVDDLVTKDELAERFAALEAKFDAVVKENQDLKQKYENQDFGTHQKQGNFEAENSPKYESFDSYSKDYM